MLTGLNQKVGNFPGVTVDKKTGGCKISENIDATIIDLPGTYSLYPKRADEWVAYKVLMGEDREVKPDMIVVIADASNLKRNLLFCSQIIDLKIPLVIGFSMMDLANQKGTQIDIAGMERELGVPIVAINPRKNKGITALKKAIEQLAENAQHLPARDFLEESFLSNPSVSVAKKYLPDASNYKVLHYLINNEYFELNKTLHDKIASVKHDHNFNATKTQAEEIMQRYNRIKFIMQQTVVENDPLKKSLFTEKLDNILLHRTWGYVILISVLFIMFQSIFWLAQFPMAGIE